MSNEVKSGLKPWMANLIVFVLELIEITLYFAIAGKAVGKILKGDISGALYFSIHILMFCTIKS